MKQKYSILDIKPFEDGDNTFSHPQAEVVTRFEEIYERFFNDDGTLVKKILQKKIEFIVNEKVILTDVLSHDQSVLNGGVLVHERILEVWK